MLASVAVLTAIVLTAIAPVTMSVVATSATVVAVVVVALAIMRTVLGCTLGLVLLVFVSRNLAALVVIMTSVLAVLVAILIAVLVAFLAVETSDAILLGTVCRLLDFGNELLALELLYLASCAVCSDDFAYSRYGQSDQVRH